MTAKSFLMIWPTNTGWMDETPLSTYKTAARKLEQEIKRSRDTWGVKHAQKYKQDLMELVRKISINPKLYAEKPEIGHGIRCVRFKGNYIVYELNEDQNGIIVLNFLSIHEPNRL